MLFRIRTLLVELDGEVRKLHPNLDLTDFLDTKVLLNELCYVIEFTSFQLARLNNHSPI